MTPNRVTSRTIAPSRSVKANALPVKLALPHVSWVWQHDGSDSRRLRGLTQQTLDVHTHPCEGFDEGVEFRRRHRRDVRHGWYAEVHHRLTTHTSDRFTSNEIREV